MTTARFAIVLACSVACACGSDSDDAAHDVEHGGAEHSHDPGTGLDAEDADFKGCPAGIPTVAPGLQAGGKQFAMKVIAAMPAEPERYANSWTVELTARDGSSPALDARIDHGQTFMPIHGHDGRVVPSSTSLAEPAQFEVDRLNFTMRGPWEVRFWLKSPSVSEDYVVFNVCVAQ
jgi:hypothetical protein